MSSTEVLVEENHEPKEEEPNTTSTSSTKHYEIPSFLDILLQSEFRILHLPPPLQVHETQHDRDYVDRMLQDHWDPTVSRAFLNQHEEDVGKEFTYGEVTSTGVRQLLEDMELLTMDDILQQEQQSNEDPVVFYDLGSGEGKLVMQVLLETCTQNVQRIVGIELSPARHAMAVHSWDKLQGFLSGNEELVVRNQQEEQEDASLEETKTNPHMEAEQQKVAHQRLQEKLVNNRKEKLHLVHGNILEYNFSDATHIYASSIFFPEKVLEGMSQKILQYHHREKGKIKVVAALSDLELLEQEDATGCCEWEKRIQRLQMSWGGANVRIYTPKDY